MRFYCIFILFLTFLAQNLLAQPMAAHRKNIDAKNYKAAAQTAIEIGDYYRSSRNFGEARNYYDAAITYGKKYNNNAAAGQASYMLALMESSNTKKTSTISYLKQSRDFYAKAGDEAGVSVVAYAAAIILKENNYPVAQTTTAFKDALDAAMKVGNSKIAMNCAAILADIYKEAGDKQKETYYRTYYNDLLRATNPSRRIEKNNEKEGLALESLSDSLKILKQMYSSLGKSSKTTLDSVLKAKLEQEKQLQHTMDSLDNVTLKLNNEQLAKKGLEEKAQLFTYIYIGSGVFVAIIIVILSVAFINKQNANRVLSAMNAEIITQKEIIEVEKEKGDQLLLNILPKATAEELKEKGYATPQYYERVTVLFTDFKGFTQMSEVLSPAQIVNELNVCFMAFDEICERYNLEKIKTIGDAYMCAGGIPLVNDTNPFDAINAGIEMMAFMESYKQEKMSQGALYFEARLGINTGPAITGVVGKKKFAYDIWGDTVNLASRMESSGEVGRVNISGNTYEIVKEHYECTYRGQVTAKGKGEVDMYFVEGKINQFLF